MTIYTSEFAMLLFLVILYLLITTFYAIRITVLLFVIILYPLITIYALGQKFLDKKMEDLLKREKGKKKETAASIQRN